jgi:hypothetical protein
MADLKEVEPKDAKYFEIIFKHYLDLFTYHAAQRLSTFRYFYFAFSVSATAFATLLSGATGTDSDLRLGWGAFALACATYLLILAFARLDRRNEQIINLNEAPLKKIQEMIAAGFDGSDEWRTLEQSDSHARILTTFRHLLPGIFFVTATVSALGALVALSVVHQLSLCQFTLASVGSAAVSWTGIWAKFPLARR